MHWWQRSNPNGSGGWNSFGSLSWGNANESIPFYTGWYTAGCTNKYEVHVEFIGTIDAGSDSGGYDVNSQNATCGTAT
jgi:hypothetical protein